METAYTEQIAQLLNLPAKSVQATLDLLKEGSTVPFIARYRKEATGSLDEVAITAIRDQLQRLEDLNKRRVAIIESLKERDLLTDELLKLINDAETKTTLEDIYLPYKPKRKTRASQAIEKGLEPLALAILNYKTNEPEKEALQYVNPEKGVESVDDALNGARDIIAEKVSEVHELRRRIRSNWSKYSWIESKVAKGKEEEGEKFKDYFSWSEPIGKLPSHRILALFRGEVEKILKVAIKAEPEQNITILTKHFVQKSGFGSSGNKPCNDQIILACEDAYKRLIAPSMATEMRGELKTKADSEAIKVFTANLMELLMAPPLGERAVLAIDPGFRTGCKIVCLNQHGHLLHNDVIYPTTSDTKSDANQSKSGKKVIELLKKFELEVIAIGNGTASRETEAFIKSIDFSKADLEKPQVLIVNESGASIYSASKVAREEFPDHDVTVRGAVSIGRRLMDPLAELVKIDPKSIGVGQYQHDVDQNQLQSSLDDTVVHCVNSVGVELNTASKELLSYVSGLSGQIAGNVVKHRQENGGFNSRAQLKKVPRLGPKAYEQCAGFLRIRNAKNPLDSSAVHPERYELVARMAKSIDSSVEDLINSEELRGRIELDDFIGEDVGRPTLEDIMSELEKPGRDPRQKLEAFEFASDINSIGDLKEGMRLPGIVTNVTNFGAFVDVGVHQDGLVHISELANRYVKDPTEIVKVQQKVEVLVLKVEEDRKRISLSMKR